MTGRRLYDLLCDGWNAQSNYARKQDACAFFPEKPVAWMSLSYGERSALTHVANRMKGVRR